MVQCALTLAKRLKVIVINLSEIKMNDNKLPHNWHDTTLYTKHEDKIPFSAWFGAALAVGAFLLAAFL